MTGLEVVVYSKPDCCLCDELKSQLRRLQRNHRFEWREVNILEDPEASARFSEEIPVVCINGQKAFKYHLDEEAFLNRLRSLERRALKAADHGPGHSCYCSSP